MIEGRHLQKIDYASRCASDRICAAENDTSDPRMHKRACAHRARLLGHVKIAIIQPPIANGCLSLRKGQHFGVRSGVLQQLDLIIGTRDDFACADNYHAYRDFVGFVCFLCLS
jgi:hypothetical protein